MGMRNEPRKVGTEAWSEDCRQGAVEDGGEERGVQEVRGRAGGERAL